MLGASEGDKEEEEEELVDGSADRDGVAGGGGGDEATTAGSQASPAATAATSSSCGSLGSEWHSCKVCGHRWAGLAQHTCRGPSKMGGRGHHHCHSPVPLFGQPLARDGGGGGGGRSCEDG